MNESENTSDINIGLLMTIMIAGSLLVVTIVIALTGWFWSEIYAGRQEKFVDVANTELGQINARQYLRLTVDAEVTIDKAMSDTVAFYTQQQDKP